MYFGFFEKAGRTGASVFCAVLILAGCGGGGDAANEETGDAAGSSVAADSDIAKRPAAKSDFDVIGAGDARHLTPEELDALWKLAQSSREDRFAALENYLADPAAARRFVLRSPNIVRAAVGLDNELRMQIAKEILTPGIASLPQDPNQRTALIRLGAELQLAGKVPGLAKLAVDDLLDAAMKATDEDEIEGHLQGVLRVCQGLPEDRAYDVFVQVCSARPPDPRLAKEWSDVQEHFAEQLPAASANAVVEEWLADPTGTEQKFHPSAILACAEKMSEDVACKVVDRLPEAGADKARQALIRRLLSAAVKRVTPEVGKTLASRMVDELERTQDEQARNDLAIQLGKIPGGLSPEIAARALAAVEPKIQPDRPRRDRAYLPAIEAIAGNLSPEAVPAVIPVVAPWIAEARTAGDRSLANLVAYYAIEACNHVTPETAPQVAKALDAAPESMQYFPMSYRAVISKLPRDTALAYVPAMRASDSAASFSAVAQGLAESADALTAQQRMALVGMILDRVANDRGPTGEVSRWYGPPLGAACKGLNEKDRASVVARLLAQIQDARTADEREIVSKGLAGMAAEMSADEAESAITALADATAKSDYWLDATQVRVCLGSALEARPPEELAVHVPAVFAAVSQCIPASRKAMTAVTKELIPKIPPEQAASHSGVLIDLLAKGAVGGSTIYGTRLSLLSGCLSSLLPRVPVEQRAAVATKAANVVARLHQEYVELAKPNTIQHDLHHALAAARIAEPFGETAKDVPPTAAKQFATTLLAFMEKVRQPSFDFWYLAGALPGVIDNLSPADAPAVIAQILKVMERAGPTEQARLRKYEPQITGPLCAALLRIPGKLDEATAKRVAEVVAGSIEEAGLRQIPCLTGAMEVVGDELTDAQLVEIVQAHLRNIETVRRSPDAQYAEPLFLASLRPLSPQGAKQAWPLIIASMDRMDNPSGLAVAGRGLRVVTSKLPPEAASEAIEVLKTSKNSHVVRAVAGGLAESAAVHPEVRTLAEKEIANIQDPEKRRLLESVAKGSPVPDAGSGDSPQAIRAQLDMATNPVVPSRMLRLLGPVPEGLDPPQIVALLKYPTMVGPAEDVLIQQLKQLTEESHAEKPIKGLWNFVVRAEEFSLAEEVRQPPAKLPAD
jgi:hypothetical protein